ncbi:TBC1 domain family member 20 [Micractinium conductrix]|uniref:TBC1 domain family member 20 n=1 Tax=Micractinium conductrix TaxID=554055 RepID=A0A2P6VFA9_9CHLO|nr:TBC1 domain family member 20 [Micractinium conductrix]|eukprot:PSC72783.1 TBC1 domain family member 20 [Micractinium conductrix]
MRNPQSSRRGRPAGDARELETVKLVNELLLERPLDVLRLRRVVAIRGLVNDGLRSRVWPLLLGVGEAAAPDEAARFAALAGSTHKDSHVVECDMARSLWSYTEGWSEEGRAAKRAALRRVIDAAVGSNTSGIFYYQGLHDIAAVLLFVCGSELAAWRLLHALAGGHLRDCTRVDLAAATETLRLLYPILERCDPELHAYLHGLQEPALEVPYFALSWLLTWFAHDVPSLPQTARLFDLFLSSHPLMPLYVAAVVIKGQRQQILACGEDGLQAYATLKKMRFLQPGQLGADELAQQAAALYQAVPPTRLARQRGIRLEHCAAIDAYLCNGRWVVPAEPRGSRRHFAQHTAQQLRAFFAPRESLTSQQRRTAALAAVITSVTGLAAMGALLVAQLQSAQWGQ